MTQKEYIDAKSYEDYDVLEDIRQLGRKDAKVKYNREFMEDTQKEFIFWFNMEEEKFSKHAREAGKQTVVEHSPEHSVAHARGVLTKKALDSHTKRARESDAESTASSVKRTKTKKTQKSRTVTPEDEEESVSEDEDSNDGGSINGDAKSREMTKGMKKWLSKRARAKDATGLRIWLFRDPDRKVEDLSGHMVRDICSYLKVPGRKDWHTAEGKKAGLLEWIMEESEE